MTGRVAILGCLAWLTIVVSACGTIVQLPARNRFTPALTGTAFYKAAAAYNWQQRDSLAAAAILSGNLPRFLQRLAAVPVSVVDSFTGKTIRGTFYATLDYISIGTNDDWARIPLTPMAAQRIADSLGCFLPTRKMVDDIYKASAVKLEPVPMYAFRDSTPTMYHHHLIIEGQRKSRKGLIAGIKKDVVISGKVSSDAKPNRVAIYGWHKLDGRPIQPLYTGHVVWYVDYSHGIRLVWRKVKVEGAWMDYVDVLKHPVYKQLLCDEADCNFYRYLY